MQEIKNPVLHFSGLNGLRAIAALAVLFAHTTSEFDSFGLDSHIYGSVSNGIPLTTLLSAYGVTIFFSLSGFLITYLLLEEKKEKGISIRNFYIRRILRIWPLYYLYLILSIITAIIYNIPFVKFSLLFYVFLAADIPIIIGEGLKLIGHYWSLGVEEQFYSFWPWIIKKSKSVLKTVSIICSVLILLKLAIRVRDIKFYNGELSQLYNVIHVIRFQCMLIGAIGAILYFEKNAFFIKVTNNFFAQFVAWMGIVFAAMNKFHIISFLDNEIMSVLTVILIMGQIFKTKRIVNLEIPIMDFIGKISFGIYVLHPLIIFYLSKVVHLSDKTNVVNYLLVYFMVLSITILIAYLSYEFFEKRFLKLKLKYTSVKTADSVYSVKSNMLK